MPCASTKSLGSHEFGKDLGLVHEFVVTGRKAGWTREDYARLVHDEKLMERFLLVLRSQGKIVANHVIETDSPPPVEEGHRIVGHAGHGNVEFHLIPGFHRISNIGDSRVKTGREMMARLHMRRGDRESYPYQLANATLLRYLIKNQGLIKEVKLHSGCCFFGTVFADRSGREYVEMIDGFEGKHSVGKFYLDSPWQEDFTVSVEFYKN